MNNTHKISRFARTGARLFRSLPGRKHEPAHGMTRMLPALFLTACALFLVCRFWLGNRAVRVSADAGNAADAGTSVSASDILYGHLYIDVDPEGVIETEKTNPDIFSLCYQSLALHPGGNGDGRSVTLCGMMPEGASAEAVDVSRQYPNPDAVAQEADRDAAVVAAYRITIIDGENEYQPDETCPIRVEITDPAVAAGRSTEVWHIRDDGTREQITDVTVAEGKIGFLSTGFSIYAIVSGPEPFVPEEQERVGSLADLSGERAGFGFFICYADSGGSHYFRNSLNSNGCLTETSDIASADKWFFEKDGSRYRLYTYVGNAKKYLHNRQNNDLELLTDQADLLEISEGAKSSSFYLKKQDEPRWLQHSGSGRGVRYWKNTGNPDNASLFVYFADNGQVPDDLYGLNGKSYGLTHYHTGVDGNALIADENANVVRMMTILVRADNRRKTLLVARDCDITLWTFHSVRKDLYRLSAEVGGQTRYLKISDTIYLTDETDASEIRVTPRDGSVMLSAGGKAITFADDAFAAEDDAAGKPAQWLCLTEQTSLNQDDFVTYSADKISLSEAPDGASVILYTRVWNDDHKEYRFYAVDADGSLYPCYERGNEIMWIGHQINTLLWTFIEYRYDDGTPKYYYELYNPYSRKFLAPQFRKGQILSDKKIGLHLPGSREGHYYSSIVAWDPDYYAFAGVRTDIANERIVPDNRKDADTFYFAILNEPLKTLHKVETVDHTQYGITMKMIDYPDASVQNSLLVKTGNNRGLLSTDLKQNGYPTATYSGQSLSGLFSGATEVNHLFLDNIYRSSGYFEYDSCQNFATLVDDEGTVGSRFTVYQELGTADNLERSTFRHGQFFPYDSITAGVYSYRNPENLYGAAAVLGDESVGYLPEDDPRKYEELHTVGEHPNYANGMEITATFLQPPNGKDAWGHDIVFQFRGDDDFWLYVNDELVIDLGGIHSALSGTVNFSTGDVNVDGRRSNLREVFRTNYQKRHPGASDSETEAYLRRFFRDGEAVFKDYSAHTMKVFYMERGGGASNLHLRFNLSHIRPGDVLLTKQVSGSDDLDYSLTEYPYQIWYKDEKLGEVHLLESRDEQINVTYQYSDELVDYTGTYTPPNSPHSYRSVYFLNPGRSVEIHFPADTIEYKVIECGVNTEVYDRVTVNGVEVQGESIGNTHRKLFDSGWLHVKERPAVVFDNHVGAGGVRTLNIWKRLYDSGGVLLSSGQDDTRFSYRIYLSNGSDDVLKPANMRKYYVRDPQGSLCRWDAESRTFLPLGQSEPDSLTAAERKAATFETSMNGAVSMIPAGYGVSMPGLPVGTRFRVIERADEIPLGYALMGYERQDGTYLPDDGSDINTGWVRANESPTMYVNNRRGFDIKVDKEWSDAAYVASHAPVCTAVYVGGQLLNGSVRQIRHPDASVRYFFDSLPAGRTLADYEIREVKVTSPRVNADGVVTSWGSLTPIGRYGHIMIRSKSSRTGEETENEYFVGYTVGSPACSSPDVPSPGNIRSDRIENTRSEGVNITLRDMKTKEPVQGGTFRLSHPSDGVIGTFTSDSEGTITVLYDFRHDEAYTLTQTETPSAYIGLPVPLVFSVGSDDREHTVSFSGVEEKWASGRGLAHRGSRNACSGDTSVRPMYDSPVIAYVEVYNMPYTLQAVQISRRTGEPLAGARFDLYRAVPSIDGESKDFAPLPGCGDMVTGNDGVISGIDNTLDPGTYYLTQTSPSQDYEPLRDDIVFNVRDDSTVSLSGTGEESSLSDSSTEVERAYTLRVYNDYVPSYAALTVTKTVGGSIGDTTRDFTFTVSVAGAGAGESYEWSKNGETQAAPLHSGDSFTLRHGESVRITLPQQIPVTVTERNGAYTPHFTLGGGEEESVCSKTFTITEDVTLDVVNTLDPAPPADDNPGSQDPAPSAGKEAGSIRAPGTGEGILGILLCGVLAVLAAAGIIGVLAVRFIRKKDTQD